MPIYKCNECSHEYNQLLKPSECEVCGANALKIIEIGEEQDLLSKEVKTSIPSTVEKTVLDQNYFTEPSPPWAISEFAKFKDGTLFQKVLKPNWSNWSILDANYSLHNVQKTDYSADVIKVNGADNQAYGILTRIQKNNAQNFDFLRICGNGNFCMGKHSKENWEYYIDWEKHYSIRKANNTINRLRVVTEGNLITGFINGKEVGSLRDDSYKPGNIGVYSENTKAVGNKKVNNGVGVYFDNIKVIITVPKD